MGEDQARFTCVYPLYVVEQDGRFALIRGLSPEGYEVTNLCVFTDDDLADRFATGHRIRGTRCRIDDAVTFGKLLQSLDVDGVAFDAGGPGKPNVSGQTVRRDRLLTSIGVSP